MEKLPQLVLKEHITIQRIKKDCTVIDSEELYNTIVTNQSIFPQQHYAEKEARNFVSKLQQHVEEYYEPINDFLQTYGIKVYQTFADVSELVGYTIDCENIIGCGDAS